jgi:hypothetical protein
MESSREKTAQRISAHREKRLVAVGKKIIRDKKIIAINIVSSLLK